MNRRIELADETDFIRRYQSGVSLKQLAEELCVSRSALIGVLARNNIAVRNRTEGMRTRWITERATEDWRERLMRSAWDTADARNDATERKVVSLYRSGLISQANIAGRLGIAKPTVGGILRKNGILSNQRLTRRAEGIVGGFNPQSQCLLESAFAEELQARGLEYIHQGAIGTRNLDFTFPASRVAVEIVRRHWNDAKSLRRERLEEIVRAGWRLWIVYDPYQIGVDIRRCADHLVACLDVASRNPSAHGQYWMIGGEGKPVPEARLKLHELARIQEPLPK